VNSTTSYLEAGKNVWGGGKRRIAFRREIQAIGGPEKPEGHFLEREDLEKREMKAPRKFYGH